MKPDSLVSIADVQERRKAVSRLRGDVQCGLAERDERDISHAIGALARALFDTDAEVRENAAEAIHSALIDGQNVAEASPAMLRVLSEETHDLRQPASLFMLDAARKGVLETSFISDLYVFVADLDSTVKSNIAQALSVQLCNESRWDEFRVLLERSDAEVREQALRAHLRTFYASYYGGELLPVLDELAARLVDRTEAVRHAAALVVVGEDKEAIHFESSVRVLSNSLSDERSVIRKEAAAAVKEAMNRFLAANPNRRGKRTREMLEPLVEALKGRFGDEDSIRFTCVKALVRVLLVTRQWDELKALIESGEPRDRAAVLVDLGRRTERYGRSNVCLGPSKLAWKSLDPIVPTLERESSRRNKSIRSAATTTLARIYRHREQWDRWNALFNRSTNELKELMVKGLSGCRSKRCGRIDELVPTLFACLQDPHKTLSDEIFRSIEAYIAPGAYSLPWRGDLSFEEQARRAQLVLDEIEAGSYELDDRIWRLKKHSTRVLHAKLVSTFHKRAKKLRGEKLLALVIDALSHDNSEVRAWAAYEITGIALSNKPVSEAIPALRTCLHDRDMFVRARVAEALGQSVLRGAPIESAIGDLVALLESDPIAPVRFAMARAVGMAALKTVELETTLPALARGLNDLDSRVRSSCLGYLFGIAGSKDGARLVLDAVMHPSVGLNEDVQRVRERCELRLK